MKRWQLKQRQSLPLEVKEKLTNHRIREFYKYMNGNVYISFSGGKDSTVLLNLIRKQFPHVPAVYVDTGLEYPEIRNFVKTINNVVWLKPQMNFRDVITNYGYPVISKENAQKIEEIRNTNSEKLRNKRIYGDRKGNGKLPEKWKFLINTDIKISKKCCNIMKREPINRYEKHTKNKPYTGNMASEGRLRETSYLKYGCNNFSENREISNPIGFWLERDIWNYIHKYNINYSEIYDKGYTRTGCMFCMFGVHLEKEPNRFQKMKNTHPKQYNFCINKLGIGAVLEKINVKY